MFENQLVSYYIECSQMVNRVQVRVLSREVNDEDGVEDGLNFVWQVSESWYMARLLCTASLACV